MRPIVLLIDDDKLPVAYYARALERRGVMVHQCFDTDGALEFVRTTPPALIIMDIMMPPGRVYEERDTDYGLRTGVLLYHDLRVLLPDVPIIVLTNVSNPETVDQFTGESNLAVHNKATCPPFELADLVLRRLAPGFRGRVKP